MSLTLRLLACLLLAEILICGTLLTRQLLRPVPRLPQVTLADPLIMPQLQQLAQQAEHGTAADWTALGEALIGQGFYTFADPIFRQALHQNPEDRAAQFGLAFCLDRTCQLEESSAEYRRSYALKPTQQSEAMFPIWSLYALGRNALREEKATEAEEYFLYRGEYAPADYQAALLKLRSDRVEEALPLIERGLNELPLSLGFHFLKHRALLAQGKMREAFKEATLVDRGAYLVSLNFNTEYVDPLRQRVGMNQRLEKLEELIRQKKWTHAETESQNLLSLIKDQPTHALHYLNVKSVLLALQLKETDLAFQRLKNIRQTGRNDEVLLELEGDAYQQIGDTKQAAHAWERALTLRPSIPLHQKLADSYETTNPEQAQKHRSRIQLLTGIQQYRSNQLQQALVPLQAAADLNPADPTPWYYLGEINFQLNRQSEAIAALQTYLERRPHDGRALARLQYLTAETSPTATEQPQ